MHDHLPLLNVGFSMRRRFLARDNQHLGRHGCCCRLSSAVSDIETCRAVVLLVTASQCKSFQVGPKWLQKWRHVALLPRAALRADGVDEGLGLMRLLRVAPSSGDFRPTHSKPPCYKRQRSTGS